MTKLTNRHAACPVPLSGHLAHQRAAAQLDQARNVCPIARRGPEMT